MMRRLRWISWVAVLMLGAVLGGMELGRRLADADPQLPLPEFQMGSLEDPERQLSEADFAGEIALLNIWASWCAPCRQEHPLLLEISESGLPIHGVNFTDDRRAAMHWLDSLGSPFTFNVFDEHGQLTMALGAMGVPQTFLLDADGQIRYKHLGLLDEQTWQQEFQPRIRRLRAEAPAS